MPVSTEHRQAKRCKHCEEADHGDSVYWNIQLDQDLLNTIVSIYPEWFKGVMNKPGGISNHNNNNSNHNNHHRNNHIQSSGGGNNSNNIIFNNSAMMDGGVQTISSSNGSGGSTDNSCQTISTTVGGIAPVQQHQLEGPGQQSSIMYPRSPPKAEVDESPLQKSMDRNKQSLKVKLMLRRPITQLVAQGIMPQLKTSPTIHEQKQKLERAKMGDLLKAKIQQRPERQELVRQHILEADVGNVDPSLAERQRMLKKCRLVDSLNDQLSHRPGPLELIKKNILHTDEPIERAVKEGQIEFRATCEGQKIKPEHPDHYMIVDDDSQSSDAQSPKENGELSPPSSHNSNNYTIQIPSVENSNLYSDFFSGSNSTGGSDMLETAAKQAGIVTVVVAAPVSSSVSAASSFFATAAPSPLSLGSSTSSLSPLSSVASPASTFTCASPALSSRSSFSLHQQSSSSSHGKDKNRKKSKSKGQQQKTRTIKFHEYKGPPSAHKNNNSLFSGNSETSYDLLLKQQQLFLQWQLEWKQKYPNATLPTTQIVDLNDRPISPSSPSGIKVNSPGPGPPNSVANSMQETPVSSPPPTPPPPPPLPPPPPPPLPSDNNINSNTKLLRNLEEMKVSDLKAELKKRNLKVSGSKPNLIERLKPFTEITKNNSNNNNITNNINSQPSSNSSIPFNDDSIPDSSVPSPTQHNNLLQMSSGTSEQHESPAGSPQSMEALTNNRVTSSSMEAAAAAQDLSEENIIKEQQRKIEELQRQLLNSQLLLQQQRHHQQQQANSTQTFQPQQAINAKANLAAFLQQQQLNNLLMQQQKLQKHLQQQQAAINNNNKINQNKNNTNNNNNNNIIISNNINNNQIIYNKNNNNTINVNYNKNNANNINNFNTKNKVNCSNIRNAMKHQQSYINDSHHNNNSRQRSNTVVLAEHPTTLLLNHINIKQEGNQQRTTSLPNFIGTFVQPHFLLTDRNVKQLVVENDSVLLNHQIKTPDNFTTFMDNNSEIIGRTDTTPNNINNNNNSNILIRDLNNTSNGRGVLIGPDINNSNNIVIGTTAPSTSSSHIHSNQQHIIVDSNGNKILLNTNNGKEILLDGNGRCIILENHNSVVNNNLNRNNHHHHHHPVNVVDNNKFHNITFAPSVVDLVSVAANTELKSFEDPDSNEIPNNLFKSTSENTVEDVDEVLEMLIGNGEFVPMDTQQSSSLVPSIIDPNSIASTVMPTTTATTSSSTLITNNNAIKGSSLYAPPIDIDHNLPSQNITLEELGIDMESFPMDLVDDHHHQSSSAVGNSTSELMDVDSDWLDRLISSELDHSAIVGNNINNNNSSNVSFNPDDSLDIFNIDDSDFKMATDFCWDRIDFAT